MADDFELDTDELSRRRTGAIGNLRTELGSLRTGRGSGSMLDPIMVDAYGSPTPINQVGTVNVPEPRMVTINVWDKGLVGKVEKAIRESGLGINPQLNGTIIMLPIPELNEERRRDLTKVAGGYAENARVSIRNLRRDGMDQIKKAKSDGLSEDDQKFWDNDTDAGPKHVAIIMDGNGRWAKQRGRPRLFGHHAGAKRVREVVDACPELGVKYITIFAFSTENWKRTQTEVSGLMRLFKRYIQREAQDLFDEGVCVRFIGDRIKLDPKLVAMMDNLELFTAGNDRVHLTIALNYGGRDEVTRAAKLLAYEVEMGRLTHNDVDAETLSKFLDTRFLPDPDLVIRTSGEARISNFLLWQSAYAEYEFIDTLWPDFSAAEFAKVVGRYGARERRFGGVTV